MGALILGALALGGFSYGFEVAGLKWMVEVLGIIFQIAITPLTMVYPYLLYKYTRPTS